METKRWMPGKPEAPVEFNEVLELDVGIKTKTRVRVRVIRSWPRRTLVLTEQPDNPGQSVTNAIEVLAIRAAEAAGVADEIPTIVEHYPARAGLPETFDLVCFGSRGRTEARYPAWKRVRLEEFEAVIGGRWEGGAE